MQARLLFYPEGKSLVIKKAAINAALIIKMMFLLFFVGVVFWWK